MTAGRIFRLVITLAMVVTVVLAARLTAAHGGAPLSQATDTGRAPSATVAFVAGDTNRYVVRATTVKRGQYVHLEYTITEARPGNRTVTYTINKYLGAPHTDVIRCKQTCSGYVTVTLWSKLRHARFLGFGTVWHGTSVEVIDRRLQPGCR